MTEHFNGLTPAEAERLAYLMEEMAEAQQVIGKILRHGPHSYNPIESHPDFKILNIQLLEKELNDVLNAIRLMQSSGDLPKLPALPQPDIYPTYRYMHHQEKP